MMTISENWLTEDQDPKLLEKIIPKIKDLLFQEEEIKYIAIQKKPAVNLLPICIIASNQRIFYCEPAHLGFTTDFSHLFWKDIKSVSFKEELFGAKFICVPTIGEKIITEYIPKVQVRKLAQFATETLLLIHQKNEEKQTQELKNTAPTLITESIPSASTHDQEVTKSNSPHEDTLSLRLQKLKTLFDRQLISLEEYEQKKASILNEL